ncbi:hybrid sensor histidine kinase/response regulator, partial [Lysobacter sp. D1-1-M9]|uniref:sensor histidine kinase n=1 Tax=Novilysobacter longmucuonensis TaxID=3098603 RepID=UPI002FC953FF
GNLLSNAARYTPDGGRIEVRADTQDGQAVIVVRDNGMGMTPEELPRMFEMFSRGGRDSSRSQGGLGIGLALSRRLAEMHGGTLLGNSDGIGQGSEFTLRVPLADDVPEPAQPSSAAPEKLARARVLVVDDNIDAGDSLGQVLGLLGAEARVVRDGEQALDMFA